jgi:hypothetical protein
MARRCADIFVVGIIYGNRKAVMSLSPGLARGTRAYPGSPIGNACINPNGVVSFRSCAPNDTTPLGLSPVGANTQGSAKGATLGWETESRWDSGKGGQS